MAVWCEEPMIFQVRLHKVKAERKIFLVFLEIFSTINFAYLKYQSGRDGILSKSPVTRYNMHLNVETADAG
jgi:hypothetical protein